jgi:hypothetical protein
MYFSNLNLYIYLSLLASFDALLFTELYIKYNISGKPKIKNINDIPKNILDPLTDDDEILTSWGIILFVETI